MDIRITNEMTSSRAGKVMDVLRAPRLWIPTREDYGNGHDTWLQKVESELITGKRNALLARVGDCSVGTIVWRKNPDEDGVIDIRNISINPEIKGRYFGAFMLRNMEYCIRETNPEATLLRVDTKATNHDMLAFLAHQDYEAVDFLDIYESGKPDVVLEKPCSPSSLVACSRHN